jgi:protein gp37
MAGKSPIEWTEHTWNPIVGCSIVSPGCTNCYAMKMARRIEAMGVVNHYNGCTKVVNGNAVWTGKLALASDDILLQPLRRKKPTTYFVNSMGDLFHEDAPDEWIDLTLAIGALCPQHTLQILTKRADRMRAYMTTPHRKRIIAERAMDVANKLAHVAGHRARPSLDHFSACFAGSGPFPNIWLGVSTERQQEADERIPHLLQTPAAVRFISAEPLLGPINLLDTIARWQDSPETQRAWVDGRSATRVGEQLINWVIVGGESGPAARPMHPAWARSLRDQCEVAGVKFFFKQWGCWAPITELPEEPQDKPYGEFHGGADWIASCTCSEGDGAMFNVGKKAAGRLLDGREHNSKPGCV